MKPAKQSWILAGGLLSALAGSLCCIGPLLAVVLGVGGFAASLWFAQWRPYFLGASFGLLALAWYLTYRRSSAQGTACAPGAGNTSKIFLWVVTAMAIPAALFPSLISASNSQSGAVVSGGNAELHVRIPAMDCAACAKGIEATLGRAPGVTHAVVDYGTKEATIAFDPKATTAARILAAIDQTGFKGELIRQVPGGLLEKSATKADACCAPDNTPAPPVMPAAERKKTMNPDNIGLFSVPLVCPAAPEIGCGSRAKPVLAALEGSGDSIAEAWLNSAGTVLAVVGGPNSSRESRTTAVQSALATLGGGASELSGEARQQGLADFLSRDDWYRGAAVDRLSQQEARIIGARLVRRVQAKVSLDDVKARALEDRIAAFFEGRFMGRSPNQSTPINDKGWAEELVTVARAQLNENEIAVFQGALVSGYRPQPGEK